MGRLLVLLVTVAVLIGAPASNAAPQQKHYLRLYAQAYFFYKLDYGSNPGAVFHGKFTKATSFSARAIVVYDGKSASVLPGTGMAVAGTVSLSDDMMQGFTVVENHEAKVVYRPHVCKGPGAVAGNPGFFSSSTGTGAGESYVFPKGAYLTVSRSGLYINPGSALTDVGCSATESLGAHGLRAGPWFTVSAPGRSRFAGSAPFSIHCADSYQHDFNTKEAGINAHSFDGFVRTSVTLTPFPAAGLAASKQRLRDSAGQEDPNDNNPGRNGGDCIR